ncbi:MAG: 3-oxoacyl-ACP synthase, partial [Spirochaetes bacterium]|nr:3-oxoacyl-ACP synthase [Spirochaetota bacterium]
MPYVSIKGTGSAVPDNIISNHDLEKMVATNDQWIRERTGIITRRVCDEKTSTSDLAIEASKNALDMSGYKGSDIDMIIVS